MSACGNEPVQQSNDIKATLSLEEQVVQTMVALHFQITQTPDIPSQADPVEEGHSVEVTQEEVESVPTSQTQPATLPEAHHIYSIWGHRQFFPIGCEASAAKDWARYFGVEINEFNFQYQLPSSDNPDLGFVGSVDGPWGQVPPYAYGVHAAPVAKVLREDYDMPAVAEKQFSLERLKKEIAADRPVIAWVIGNIVWGEPYEYIDSKGNPVTVAAYEHVVIITGYTEDTIRYMNNGKYYDVQTKYFLRSWEVLGNMVVYLKPE